MTVIPVTDEAQQPGVGGAPGLVADALRGKHRVEVLHQFACELVGLHLSDARGGQQFGGGACPAVGAPDKVRRPPQVVRNGLPDLLLGGFLLQQLPDAVPGLQVGGQLSMSRPVTSSRAVSLIRWRCSSQMVSAAPIRPLDPEICWNGSDAPCLRR